MQCLPQNCRCVYPRHPRSLHRPVIVIRVSQKNYPFYPSKHLSTESREQRDTKDTLVSRHMKIKSSIIYYLCSQKTAKRTRRNRI